jgi:C-terminal processing protease CtpA/Prc
MVVFDEAWTTLDHRFWTADFNGANWPALRDQWRPYIAGARTSPELRRDINLLIGEMNSSHSGISKPAPPSVRTGRLGMRFERAPFEANGELVIREIVPLGPAALATVEGNSAKAAEIKVGDKLIAVDGTAITAATNLDSLLQDRAGKRTVLTIEAAGKKLEAWVESRRAYVEKISGGKLGYVHIAAMGDADLAQLYLDLDVQNQSKQGVVVDVRNNNGGYVNGRVIDVFARRNYLLMTPRGGETEPSRQALGQRALGLPTVLVTNESTLSDGEDFTEGYRTLGLGKVVGTPTAGWIVFTGAARLIDGSSVRVPGDRIRTLEGKDMEMHPRPVDIEQLRPLGETETGEDIQLKKAVEVLLTQLK